MRLTLPLIIRTLGKGKTGTRDLTSDEAGFFMQKILEGEVSEAQLGAFLMLMRVKEETAEEMAGLVNACRRFYAFSETMKVDIDWPCYAGKKKQPSWYVLAAKLLAENGYQVLMHGSGEHTAGRQYARQVCIALSIPIASSLAKAEDFIVQNNIAFLPLKSFSPLLDELMDKRMELGLRSPVNTLVRHLNPLKAKLTLQGMFHPAYQRLHHQTAQLLNDPLNIVLKGEGGEFELRPDNDVSASVIRDGQIGELLIKRALSQRAVRPETPDLDHLVNVWKRQDPDEYGENAVIQTVALILSQLKGDGFELAIAEAGDMWDSRGDKRKINRT